MRSYFKGKVLVPAALSGLLTFTSPGNAQPQPRYDPAHYQAILQDPEFRGVFRQTNYSTAVNYNDRNYTAMAITYTASNGRTRESWLVWDQASGRVVTDVEEYLNVAHSASVREKVQLGSALWEISQWKGQCRRVYDSIKVPSAVIGSLQSVIGFLPNLIGEAIITRDDPTGEAKKKLPTKFLRDVKEEVRKILTERVLDPREIRSNRVFEETMRSLLEDSIYQLDEALYLGNDIRARAEKQKIDDFVEDVIDGTSTCYGAVAGLASIYAQGDPALGFLADVIINPMVEEFTGGRGGSESLIDFYPERVRHFFRKVEKVRDAGEKKWGKESLRADAYLTVDTVRRARDTP
ncbi:MAG: hypothetical protein HY367_04190 [Candidatus Aenigmarchaeota archaeon]|nr:hypothetical protein [Candidatus Aenigmarchaeota archaeon]